MCFAFVVATAGMSVMLYESMCVRAYASVYVCVASNTNFVRLRKCHFWKDKLLADLTHKNNA